MLARARRRWVDVTSNVYVYIHDAEARRDWLAEKFPNAEFRVRGSASRGYRVERREK